MSLIEIHEATQAHGSPFQNRVVEDQSTFAELSIGQLETSDGGEIKVLGHLWNRSEDTSIIKFDMLVKIAQALPATKRNVLKVVASVYDPLGILSPIVVKIKVLPAVCNRLGIHHFQTSLVGFGESGLMTRRKQNPLLFQGLISTELKWR